MKYIEENRNNLLEMGIPALYRGSRAWWICLFLFEAFLQKRKINYLCFIDWFFELIVGYHSDLLQGFRRVLCT